MMPRSSHRFALPGAFLVLLLLMITALGVGDMPLSPERIWNGLLGRDELAAVIVWQIRLPRLIVAVFVGGSLAASGLVMQAYFRNSLASPGLLGVSSGGTAGAVVASEPRVSNSSGTAASMRPSSLPGARPNDHRKYRFEKLRQPDRTAVMRAIQ